MLFKQLMHQRWHLACGSHRLPAFDLVMPVQCHQMLQLLSQQSGVMYEVCVVFHQQRNPQMGWCIECDAVRCANFFHQLFRYTQIADFFTLGLYKHHALY